MICRPKQGHSKELLQKAIYQIQQSFYKMKSFWVECSGIDGTIYGSYKNVNMEFINNRSYICIEADYAPSFHILDVVHIPYYQNPELYKELGISNRYSNVELTPENISIIEKYGYKVT